WRLARIFDAAGVPVTVSGSAVALELNPAVAEWMNERGHDLMGHGWRWTEAWTMSRDEEREQILRAIETSERVLGSRPLGWNSRSWPSENTRSLLVEVGGFLYHSEGAADDVPYYESIDGTTMLVVPYSKTYNDARFVTNPGFVSPRDYVETAVMGLDELVRESDERATMITVVAHARWSGQAGRAAAIREIIEHAQSLQGVRFMRRIDIARWWLEQYPPPATSTRSVRTPWPSAPARMRMPTGASCWSASRSTASSSASRRSCTPRPRSPRSSEGSRPTSRSRWYGSSRTERRSSRPGTRAVPSARSASSGARSPFSTTCAQRSRPRRPACSPAAASPRPRRRGATSSGRHVSPTRARAAACCSSSEATRSLSRLG